MRAVSANYVMTVAVLFDDGEIVYIPCESLTDRDDSRAEAEEARRLALHKRLGTIPHEPINDGKGSMAWSCVYCDGVGPSASSVRHATDCDT